MSPHCPHLLLNLARSGLPLLLLLCLVALTKQAAASGPTATAAASRPLQQQTCPTSYFQCSVDQLGNGFNGICCRTDQVCSLDASSNPACCPSGAVCTGVVPTPTAVSYVSNPYFAFPYIPTTFTDQPACTSSLYVCSYNYDACLAGLQGSTRPGFGVTVAVPGGGGTTVAPTQASHLGPSSATSICSSLSAQACHGIIAAQCPQLSETARPRFGRVKWMAVGTAMGLALAASCV